MSLASIAAVEPSPPARSHKVLIVTGALLDAASEETGTPSRSLSWWWNNLAAQVEVLVSSRQAIALALHGKASFVEPLFHSAIESRLHPPVWPKEPQDEDATDTGRITVTEVALATLLVREGIPFEAVPVATIARDPARRERLLAECSVVFVSSTLLLDLTELELVARWVKRPWNRVVFGGTLVANLHARWTPVKDVDVLAVGYGELLVPALAAWIRSDFRVLDPPTTGRLRAVGPNRLLYSGVPTSSSLDGLPSPDWGIARQYHGRRMRIAGYESVRGCPYRCGFCDYPFLFDDTKFRMRSAERIAADWQAMVEQGVEFILCLDSLFTIPKRRLIRLCELLVERDVRVEWLCYARADDLLDPEVPRLMRRAGCRTVNLGIESGSQRILDAMDKRCTVESGGIGIRNARAAGIHVSANFVVGFPGETPETLQETLDFIETYRPDTCWVYPLNLGSELAPMMSPANRLRFGLVTRNDGRAQSPHWSHHTMNALDAIDWAHWLRREIMTRGAAIDQTVAGARTASREEQLAYQRSVATKRPLLRAAWRLVRACTRELARIEMRRTLGASPG